MPKLKSRKPFRQEKWPVYQALHRINEAFHVIEREITVLENFRVLPFEPLYRFRVEEMKAAINHRIVDLLKMREERDWAFWQRQRLIREKRLNPELRRQQKS